MSAVHSKETIASIARFAENGLSASQIAAVIGNMTRNAVIGLAGRNKIHFHGLPGGRKPRERAVAKPPYMQCEPVKEEVPTDLITFEQLGPDTCRFIFGTDHQNYLFCGKRVVDGRSWCLQHCKICFQLR